MQIFRHHEIKPIANYVKNGGVIVLKETIRGTTFFRTPIIYATSEGFGAIQITDYDGTRFSEYFIGYPTDHPDDLYFLKATQV